MRKNGSKNEMSKKLMAAIIAVTMCVAILIPTVNAGKQANITITSSPSQTIEKVSPQHPTFGTTWHVPGNSATIQGAITLASDGDTIVVAAGTYYENQITINKALTIQGARWETTIIDGGGALLSSVGLVRIIATGDVTFSGFTVKNAGGPSNLPTGDHGDDKTNVGIYAQSSSSSATYTVSWNKIIGTNDDSDEEDYGLYANGGQEQLIFTHNIITQTGANSVLIEINPGSTDISYNTIDAGCWGIDAIFSMTYGSTDITSLQKISHNTIDVGTGINAGTANKVTGISFMSSYSGTLGDGKYTNIEISYNTINNVRDLNRRGISLYNDATGTGGGGEISDAIIKGNIINGVAPQSNNFAIRLCGLVTNTVIEENHITYCDMGFFGTNARNSYPSVYPTGTTLIHNNFEHNTRAIVWDGTTILNAENNWWGTTAGPQSGDITGTGVVDSAPYLVVQWYIYGLVTNIAQDKYYGSIQVAIDAATSGNTIHANSGTYFENQIIIDKALIVQGDGWATTIIDGYDALLTSSGLIRIIAAGDVTFSGFTVQNAGGSVNGGDFGDGLTNIGIYASSSSSSATYTVSWNKIIGTNDDSDEEDYGLYANGGQEHLIFTHNIITQTGANSVLIEINPGSTDISFNTIDAGCWGIDPIYYFTYSGNHITTLQKISNNTIDVSTGSNPRVSPNNKITGIGFSGAWKGYFEGVSTDSGTYTHIVISDNLITGVGVWNRGIALDNFAWDDGVGGEISNAVIKGNTITGPSIPTGYSTSQCFGIRLSGLVTNTIIRENHITHCCYSFFGTSGFSGGSTVYPTGTVVHYNVFMNNGYGLRWEGPTPLDALYNYWGSSSGPTPTFSGDGVYGNVDYTPYIDTNPPWQVTLSFKKQGTSNTLDTAVFGEKIGASDGKDAYDVPKPAEPPAPYIYTWFDAGLIAPYNRLWEDYRFFPHEAEVWDLYVKADPDSPYVGTMDVEISWLLADIITTEYAHVDLYSASDVHLADMTIQSSYTLSVPDDTNIHLKIKCSVYHSITVKQHWNLISLPVYDTISKANIIVRYDSHDHTWAEAVSESIVLVTLYDWLRGLPQTYAPTNTLVPGNGYWMWAYHDCELLIASNAVGTGHITDLQTKWNIMGLPYETSLVQTLLKIEYPPGTTLTWAEAVAGNIILRFIYGWDSTTQMYTLQTTFEPGQGYWMYAYYDCLLKQ